MVPCPNQATPSIFFDSVSNTSIKVRPIIFLFCSGSVTPFSSCKNIDEASTGIMFRPNSLYPACTSLNSSFLNNPLSTKMQYKFLPMALCNNTAATVESTPPDNPITTLSLPSCCFKLSTVSSMNERAVQS